MFTTPEPSLRIPPGRPRGPAPPKLEQPLLGGPFRATPEKRGVAFPTEGARGAGQPAAALPAGPSADRPQAGDRRRPASIPPPRPPSFARHRIQQQNFLRLRRGRARRHRPGKGHAASRSPSLLSRTAPPPPSPDSTHTGDPPPAAAARRSPTFKRPSGRGGRPRPPLRRQRRPAGPRGRRPGRSRWERPPSPHGRPRPPCQRPLAPLSPGAAAVRRERDEPRRSRAETAAPGRGAPPPSGGREQSAFVRRGRARAVRRPQTPLLLPPPPAAPPHSRAFPGSSGSALLTRPGPTATPPAPTRRPPASPQSPLPQPPPCNPARRAGRGGDGGGSAPHRGGARGGPQGRGAGGEEGHRRPAGTAAAGAPRVSVREGGRAAPEACPRCGALSSTGPRPGVRRSSRPPSLSGVRRGGPAAGPLWPSGHLTARPVLTGHGGSRFAGGVRQSLKVKGCQEVGLAELCGGAAPCHPGEPDSRPAALTVALEYGINAQSFSCACCFFLLLFDRRRLLTASLESGFCF